MNNPSFSEIKRYLMEENDWTVLEADDFLLASAKHFEDDGKASKLNRDEWTILAMEWMEERVANTRAEGFICLTRDQRWGWGATLSDAVKAARKAGSRDSAKGNRAIYKLPAGARDAYVDQMGQVHWEWSDDVPSLDDSDARRRTGEWVEQPKG